MSRATDLPKGKSRGPGDTSPASREGLRCDDAVEQLARLHRRYEGWTDVQTEELTPAWRDRYEQEMRIAVRACQDTALEAAYQRATRSAMNGLFFDEAEFGNPQLVDRTDRLVRSTITAFRESLAQAKLTIAQLLDEPGVPDEPITVKIRRRGRVLPFPAPFGTSSGASRAGRRGAPSLHAPPTARVPDARADQAPDRARPSREASQRRRTAGNEAIPATAGALRDRHAGTGFHRGEDVGRTRSTERATMSDYVAEETGRRQMVSVDRQQQVEPRRWTRPPVVWRRIEAPDRADGEGRLPTQAA